MAAANPLWRAPRIHGELKMLGIALSECTVSRILRKLRRPPTQETVSLQFAGAFVPRKRLLAESKTDIS